MEKIRIYTLADKRPDFIPLQYETLKKFLSDEFEYIVLNNAISNPWRRHKISKICKMLGVRCLKVKNEKEINTSGPEKSISWLGTYINPNVACSYPLKWAWEMICRENSKNPFAIIDSDMFICKKISFTHELGDAAIACMLQYRGLKKNRSLASVTYPWNGICIFNPLKIKDIASLSWDCGTIEGYPVDVGGQAHYWLQKNQLQIRHISEYSIHRYEKREHGIVWIEAVLNGNYHYSFSYNLHSKNVGDFSCYEEKWTPGDNILPHFSSGFQSTLIQKTIDYFERFLLDKQSYPNPPFIGFIEFETFSSSTESFIIHHKAGSGYVGFNKKYRKEKLAFIKQLCA